MFAKLFEVRGMQVLACTRMHTIDHLEFLVVTCIAGRYVELRSPMLSEEHARQTLEDFSERDAEAAIVFTQVLAAR